MQGTSRKEINQYLAKLASQGLFKYEVKTKFDGTTTYGELQNELEIEVDRIMKLLEVMSGINYYVKNALVVSQADSNIFSKENLSYNRYYVLTIGFFISRHIEAITPSDTWVDKSFYSGWRKVEFKDINFFCIKIQVYCRLTIIFSIYF